ncbi:MAG: pyridoxamine 5'-phosphate oxidase family protein [Ruminococcus sp.]|nr:pyridoxamine 5'-phosphate oxidase family protein [Ruminococcus sp.]
MRRNDREITDSSAIEAFIAGEQIIRVAFYDGGDIYIVPVNYGYIAENGEYRFFFHGARAGRKYELAKSSPTVGFEIDGRYKVLESETACGFSAQFQSAIGTGRLRLIEDADEKAAALDCVMKQVTGRSGWTYSGSELEAVAVFELTADKMSCKAK